MRRMQHDLFAERMQLIQQRGRRDMDGRVLSPDEVRERLSPLPAQVVASEALEGFLGRLRPESVDLSSFLALLMLLVLAVESVQSITAAREADGSADSDR